MLIVLTTVPNTEEAEGLAERIVSEKLAACVQIVPRITSIYFWEGKIAKENELLLLIKTKEELYEKLATFIKSNHTYEVPEITAISADKVSDEYAKWLADYLA
ncbi:MAG TPA: divalent-cation tolerance protein CutA [Pyrinomonadaceae bacterium]|jgi:periplasmic divalent cation tolerance protein|nr:divalent-cation tolerance protein CutA [Pyrinomonadaceae bacterium]